MSEQTKIAWCDSTINWWEGCTKVSAGCQHCYAEARDKRFTGGKLWGKGAPRRKSKSAVKDALRYNKLPWICDECGHAPKDAIDSVALCEKCNRVVSCHPRRIFSLSLGDWLDAEVPIEWLAEMLDTIRQCDQVTWILCSKRWENFEKRISDVVAYDCANRGNEPVNGKNLSTWLINWINEPYQNIIGLCSVENQEMADSRIAQFLSVPLACRGLSLEPLLGPVDVAPYLLREGKLDFKKMPNGGDGIPYPWRGIDWVIVGGESGANAREFNMAWGAQLIKQGKAAGVATFFKQAGANSFREIPDIGRGIGWLKQPSNFKDKKGGDINELPEMFRVQEWPKGF